jgi:hypothetical protein
MSYPPEIVSSQLKLISFPFLMTEGGSESGTTHIGGQGGSEN